MTDFRQGNESRRTAEIESEIETTRNRMGQGIEAIGEKLSPDRMKQQAKDAVSRKTREAGASLWRTAKENPVPTAIVALGLTLLFKARGKRRDAGNGNGHVGEAGEKVGQIAHETADKVGHVAQQAAQKAKRTGSRLQRFFQNNPAIAGAGVLVLGAAAGALVPGTEKENRLMGHSRDELVDQTKDIAAQTQETFKEKMSEQGAGSSTQSQRSGY